MAAETPAPISIESLQNLENEIRSRIDRGDFKLPVLPQVAAQVLSLTKNPNFDLGSLSNLIHRDQALAGHVLRIANSVVYGGEQTIVSLQQAVSRLGMRLIGEIAATVSLKGSVFRATGFETEVKAVWKHALFSAIYGKEIARMSRRNVEGQFLCSLLHTAGKPVIYQMLGDRPESEDHETIDRAFAVELTEKLHTLVIPAVAEKWKLPKLVSVCCTYYQHYEDAPTLKDEVAMTYLSDRLASWLENPETNEADSIGREPVLAQLNFYPEDIDSLFEKAEEVLANAKLMASS